jgi:hypothetical protein
MRFIIVASRIWDNACDNDTYDNAGTDDTDNDTTDNDTDEDTDDDTDNTDTDHDSIDNDTTVTGDDLIFLGLPAAFALHACGLHPDARFVQQNPAPAP